MCEWASGVAVYIDECEVAVKTLPCEDSHTKIRKACGLDEDDKLSGTVRRSTPIEYVPVGEFSDLDAYEFRHDAGRPEWWTDQHTTSAMRQMRSAVARRLKGIAQCGIYRGDIYARSATSVDLPALQTSGGIDARSATSVDLPALQTSGGIFAHSATSVDLPALQTSGDIDARSATGQVCRMTLAEFRAAEAAKEAGDGE